MEYSAVPFLNLIEKERVGSFAMTAAPTAAQATRSIAKVQSYTVEYCTHLPSGLLWPGSGWNTHHDCTFNALTVCVHVST